MNNRFINYIKENHPFFGGIVIGAVAAYIDSRIHSTQMSSIISQTLEFGFPTFFGYIVNRQQKLLKKEKKRLEEILMHEEEIAKTYEENLNMTIEKVPTPLVILNDQQKIVGFNKSFQELTGYSKKEILNQNYLNIVEKHYLKDSKKKFKQLIEKHSLTHYKKVIVGKNNKKIITEVYPFIWYENNKPSKVVAFLVDNTKTTKLIKKLKKRNKDLDSTINGIFESFTKAINQKDHYTYQHSTNVANIAQKISVEYNKRFNTQIDTKKTYFSGLIHDIGKIFIKDNLLNKPGKLTPEEFDEIKKHTEYGWEIISPIPKLKEISSYIRYHHENYNGSGYYGLKDGEIPLIARILRVADVYDALTTKRPYRSAVNGRIAKEYIIRNSGKLFDPKVVEAFSQIKNVKP